MRQTAMPYGAWPSPITPARVVERSVSLGSPSAAGDDLYWLEGRPADGGRQVVVRLAAGAAEPEDVTPAGFSARTRVHEYGGGAYLATGDELWFSNLSDGRVYRQERSGGLSPRAVTPVPPEGESWRYADFRPLPGPIGGLVAVRERHASGQVRNEIVWLPGIAGGGDAVVLVSGRDFVAAPRPAPNGAGQLAWLTWDLPDMPWDAAELWVAGCEIGTDGPALVDARRVAGGRGEGGPSGSSGPESAAQPEWLPDRSLVFAADRTGWWNLYRWSGTGEPEPLTPPRAVEFAGPAWLLDNPGYAVLPDGHLACRWAQDGIDHLGVLDPATGELSLVSQPYTVLGPVRAAPGGVVTVGTGPTHFPVVVRIGLDGTVHVLRRSQEIDLDPGWISMPRAIEFASAGGRRAHAFYYPPRNPDCTGVAGARPPLLVTTHGGPTSAAFAALNLGVLFWTSRGFGLVDVNYGGSTGFGRPYREQLRGRWGVIDVEDTVAAAAHLVEAGEADGARLAVRGSSAGGWTTLCALTFTDAFAAGASYYGIADAEAFVRDTHKFESRYLDGLIGPWPEAAPTYRARSPIHHADQLSSAVILFQGLDDPVVPPNQAEMMVDALAGNGLPFAYVAFAGEEHGFRQAATIQRCLEAELSFYGQVFGFDPAGDIEPVKVENLLRPPLT